MQKNELKAHVLSLATHTARSVLFQEIARNHELHGRKDIADKYWRKSQEETAYADTKQNLIWSMIDQM